MMQALKMAAAAAKEVERFTEALPPLPVWDSLPVPAPTRDSVAAAVDSTAEGGSGAAAEQTSSEPADAAEARSGLAEAGPAPSSGAVPPGADTAIVSSPASGDAQASEPAQPAHFRDPAAVAMQLAATDAADTEALAAADLAADSSLRDRRCAYNTVIDCTAISTRSSVELDSVVFALR